MDVDGTAIAREPLLAQCYGDMRRVARRILAGDGLAISIQPTDLAHEAAVRLIMSDADLVAADRGHMLALAARTMRRILIDEARKAGAAKRHAPTLMTIWPGAPNTMIDLADLDEALGALQNFSDDHAAIVEMRFTLGLTVEETARQTGIPERTVKRRWQVARAWLQDYLQSGDDVRAG
ncbi:ECF-type sigma factor [Sphingobium nicotianae]|uniref:Sigma-70 family RNA polymerase sigma factor n=1 Tax=Sphingobium nicotianae TaxID=2782607 RepID=A0A9X1AJY1_9SPHN|nr:ECF-type sigma factor [Sphingobium nicotianae]MBT2185558.1 sigma-70 family RNA polymerase sigma factor [Sphingobium nicotianae]